MSLSNVIAGRYRLDAELGRGGFGTTYEAYDAQMDRTVALKIEHQNSRQSSLIVHEIEFLKRLDHPGIVRLLDADPSAGYLVMEKYDGNLRDLIAEDQDFLREQFATTMSDLVGGLVEAHSNSILHRDIKPENILYKRLPDGPIRLALADFGIAKGSLAGTTFAGTYKYMAPELRRGRGYDSRADIYSLGVTFYEAAIGPYPDSNDEYMYDLQTRTSLSFAADGLAPELSDLIDRMTRWEVEQRCDSALRVMAELEPHGSHPGRLSSGIDAIQFKILVIYQDCVAGSPQESIAHMLARATAARNLMKYYDSLERSNADALLLDHLRWIFAWICTFAGQMSLSIAGAVRSKYGTHCPYCIQAVCECAAYSLEAKRDITLQIYLRGLGSVKSGDLSIPYLSTMFSGIYGDQNSRRDLGYLINRLLIEIGELTSVMLRHADISSLDRNVLIRQELADVVAWFFAVADRLSIDVERDVATYFDTGCPVCGLLRCQGDSGINLVGDEWDSLERFFGELQVERPDELNNGDGS